jgi:hypothetical protein
MQTVLTYRGRAIQHADVAFIRELIASKPEANRRALSIELCRAWGWTQPNGALCDAVCRGLLLALHRGGHVELPFHGENPFDYLVALFEHEADVAAAPADWLPWTYRATLAALAARAA